MGVQTWEWIQKNASLHDTLLCCIFTVMLLNILAKEDLDVTAHTLTILEVSNYSYKQTL